jgi:hypothetical protein
MKAPKHEFSGSLTDVQWRRIAPTIRAGLCRNPDQIAVSGSPGWFTVESWGPSDPEVTVTLTRPACVYPPENMWLRTAIEWTVREVIFHRPSSPPWATVEELQGSHRQRERLREAYGASIRQHWPDELRQVPDMLARTSGELQDFMLPKKKGNSRLNAYNGHRAHLIVDLRDLWVTTLGGEPTGKATEAFIRTCLEAALGKPEKDNGVRRWLERYDQGHVYFHY